MLRPMGDFKVEQRTKDGYFNATTLLKQWNEANEKKKEIKIVSIALIINKPLIFLPILPPPYLFP